MVKFSYDKQLKFLVLRLRTKIFCMAVLRLAVNPIDNMLLNKMSQDCGENMGKFLKQKQVFIFNSVFNLLIFLLNFELHLSDTIITTELRSVPSVAKKSKELTDMMENLRPHGLCAMWSLFLLVLATVSFLGKESNFDKLTPALQQSWMPFGTPYDYFSIMHFSPFAFTKDKKPTITAKDNRVSQNFAVDIGKLLSLLTLSRRISKGIAMNVYHIWI